jgi:hypothetical protein
MLYLLINTQSLAGALCRGRQCGLGGHLRSHGRRHLRWPRGQYLRPACAAIVLDVSSGQPECNRLVNSHLSVLFCSVLFCMCRSFFSSIAVSDAGAGREVIPGTPLRMPLKPDYDAFVKTVGQVLNRDYSYSSSTLTFFTCSFLTSIPPTYLASLTTSSEACSAPPPLQ